VKHAYLILAHTKFQVLKTLIKLLDNVDNDIFIHFDKKVKKLPELNSQYSKIIIIKERINVHWGDVSMIEAEYNLFESAHSKRNYDYYHLLSGVDLPIKSVEYVHKFFEENKGKEFIGFNNSIDNEQLLKRVNFYHLFPKDFQNQKGPVNLLKRTLRYFFILLQKKTGFQRNHGMTFKKGTQWISVTNDFVEYMIMKKDWVLKNFKQTYCGDEIFAQTLCWNSEFRENIYDPHNEGRGSLRYIGWVDGVLKDFETEDIAKVLRSESLFARKFNENRDVLSIVEKYIENGTNEN